MGNYINDSRLPDKKPALVVYDFDGVMTDNRVIVREDGVESVYCNRADGLGINIIKKLNISQLLLSTENNPVVSARAKKMGIPVIQGAEDKRQLLLDYCQENVINPEEVFYVGNDVNDLEAMSVCGFKICPSDSHPDILQLADMVTHAEGGHGVIRELSEIVKGKFRNPSKNQGAYQKQNAILRADTVRQRLKENICVKEKLLEDTTAVDLLASMSSAIAQCLRNGGKVIFAGNGGSFAGAIHLACEFVSRFTTKRVPMSGVALGGNYLVSTAVGNDYASEDILVRELSAVGHDGDVFIGISTSDNRPNIMKCLEAAKDIGIACYGMTGSQKCRMDDFCECLKVPSNCTPRIQETHIAVGHILCELVENELYGKK